MPGIKEVRSSDDTAVQTRVSSCSTASLYSFSQEQPTDGELAL